MRPTRWRRSTDVVVGVAVLLLVAARVGGRRGDRRRALQRARPSTRSARGDRAAGIVPVADSAPKPTPDRLAGTLAPVACRSEPRQPDRPDHRRDDRRAAVGAGRRRADAAGVDQQDADGGRGATDPRPRRPADHPGAAHEYAPGVVVLKGGGDPTLSAAPKGQDTWYRDAARISDLAEQVERSGIDVTAVQVDVSAYSGPTMAPGWDPADIDGGDIAPMEVGHARRRPHATRQCRVAAVHDARAWTPAAPWPWRWRSIPRPSPCCRRRTARRQGDRVGAVAAADGAAAGHDERLRQRDGRVDRPRGRRREPCRRASTARPRRCSTNWTTPRSIPAARGCWTPAGFPSMTG